MMILDQDHGKRSREASSEHLQIKGKVFCHKFPFSSAQRNLKAEATFATPISPENGGIDIRFVRLPLFDRKYAHFKISQLVAVF